MINDTKTLTTGELLSHTNGTSMLFYIAAVVNATQYRDGYRMKYALGTGDNTTDVNGFIFHNRRVDGRYLIFFRVFSANSTLQVFLLLTQPYLYTLLFFFRMKFLLPQKWSQVCVNEICFISTICALCVIVIPPQQSSGDSGSSSSAVGPVVGVIVALLLIIAVIVVVILLLF